MYVGEEATFYREAAEASKRDKLAHLRKFATLKLRPCQSGKDSESREAANGGSVSLSDCEIVAKKKKGRSGG